MTLAQTLQPERWVYKSLILMNLGLVSGWFEVIFVETKIKSNYSLISLKIRMTSDAKYLFTQTFPPFFSFFLLSKHLQQQWAISPTPESNCHLINQRITLQFILMWFLIRISTFSIIIFDQNFMKIQILLTVLVASAAAIQCGKGGLPCDQNQCHYPSYIEGCVTYSPNDSCAQCEYNYKLIAGKCYYSPKNGDSGCCLDFGSDAQCDQCSGGLQLNPTSLLCEDRKITGCLKKDAKGCSICASDFDLVSGKCIPSISKCTQYDAQFNCVACEKSAELSNGACIPLISIQRIPSCQVHNEYGCVKCENGFSLTPQGTCQASITGCVMLDSNGLCQICYAPYYQLTNGTCSVVGCTKYSNGACSCCDETVGFKLTQGRCQIAGCTYFNQRGCVTCEQGLVAGSWGCRRPQGKVCLICKSDEFLGADGQCQKRDVHCISYQGGKCIKCCEGFYLDSSSKCRSIQPGCIYSNGQCSSCSPPFQYVDGTCTISGCVKYSRDGCIDCDARLVLFGNVCGLPNCLKISNFKCLECNSGYALDQSGNCMKVDPNCLVRNSLNMCLKCKDGYQLDRDGRCSTLKFGCNYVDGRCTSCRSPFVYIPEKESCEIDGCLSYFVGGCESCSQGYSLLYNTCKLPNCLISKNGKCVECDPDYVFRLDGTCVSKDQFCEKMDQYGTCIKCMDKYYYSSKLNRCVRKEPGCEYDQNEVCYKCNPPFTYDNQRCIIKGCLNLIDSGCSQCRYPYSLTRSKTCQIANCLSYDQNDQCSSCANGYALSQERLCQLQDQNCAQYDDRRSKCMKCIKGYYVDANGRCQYADKHCSYFDGTGICINCDRLYFLNPFGKCQLRDPQCQVYTNGMCSQCIPYYFPKNGICMSNMPGCQVQKSYDNCVQCERGYNLKNGNCVAAIKKLTWNSIDMDFFGDDNSNDQKKSKSVFTVGVDSKLNLVPLVSSNNMTVFYSSLGLNNASILLSAQGSNGWSPSGTNSIGQFVGIKSSTMQTYYACDIKQLAGSSLKSFTLEYSMDGQNFLKIDDFSFNSVVIGAVSTFYFKPVYAQAIRIVVKEGTPNIRFEFYISSEAISSTNITTDTFISKTVATTIDGVETGGISQCANDGLCWAGVQSCEPKKIQGFSLIYNQGSNDRVSEVKIEYSTDGVNFNCFNKCNSLPLTGNGYSFATPLLAEKMHVHFTKYSGQPKFGIRFDFV